MSTTPPCRNAACAIAATPTTSSADWMKSARGRVEDFKRLQELGLISQGGDFFPSVHYPPITMYPLMQQEELFKTYTLPATV